MLNEIAIGIDVGGTHCRAALVAVGGNVVAFAQAATPTEPSPEPFIAAVLGLFEQVARQGPAGTTARGPVGIGLPGVVDEAGVMRRAVNLPFLEGIEVRAFFARALGRRVFVDTDVNAAAWAQWRHSGRPAARFAYLSIGTGVGAGVILDGELVRHTHNGPGHWGHAVVDSSTGAPRCRCGGRGCLEAIVAGPAWRTDERLADASFARKARAVAAACLQLAGVYAVEAVALGGGVIDARTELVDAARRDLEEMRGSVAPAPLRVEKAALSSNRAGAIGAALLAMARSHRADSLSADA